MKKILLGMAASVVIAVVGVVALIGGIWIAADYNVMAGEAKNAIQCAIHENEPVNYITVAEDTNGDGVMEESYIYYEVE